MKSLSFVLETYKNVNKIFCSCLLWSDQCIGLLILLANVSAYVFLICADIKTVF